MKSLTFQLPTLIHLFCFLLLLFNDVDVNREDMFWIPDLGCEVRSVEEIVKPITDCSDNSVVFGYENPIKEETLILGEACYSETEGRTKFVRIRTARSNQSSERRRTIALKVENLNYLAQQHPDSKYKIDFLIAARIDELNQRLQKLSIEKVPFLEPRHFMDMLSLPNGQLYSILKLGWNFAVTNGFDHLSNYDLLMADIQKMQEGNFDLYMGTHSTLTLKNTNNNDVDIYLLPDERKFPVPKFLWVAVATPNPANAFGFLISNNIDLTQTEVESGPCESKCTQISWLDKLLDNGAYQKPENGYVWCCDIHTFVETVPEMPKLYIK